MPVWLWWLAGGIATYVFNVHAQRQSALQAIDVGLLMIRSSSAQAASAAGTTTIQSPAGALQAETATPQDVRAKASALSVATLAPDWLSLATSVQSQGYPALAYSIATLGMTLLEAGQLNLTT